MIDLHCHLLPGVDDGAKTWDETLGMCRMAADDGIRTVFATPHFQETGMRVPRDTVLRLVAELRARLEKENISLDVRAGNEIYAHPHMETFVETKQAATYGDAGQYVLFELPPQGVPLEGLKEMVFRLTLKGITPVLAHPERNAMFRADAGALAALVSQGVVCQITAAALSENGDAASREACFDWFRGGLAHLLSTDAHNLANRAPRMARAFEVLKKEIPENVYRAVRDEYPSAVLEGRAVNAPPPDVLPADFESAGAPGFSFRRLFGRAS
jgi:protein-tyrosine phosphatase